MPTSWSIPAAQSSSRSPSLGLNWPPSTSESNISSASSATCSTWARSDSYWIARLRTAAARTSSNSGSSPASSSRARNTPSRRLASVTSMPAKSPISSTVSIVSAEARMMSPRPGLMPGTSPRSDGGSDASVETRSPSVSARDHESLDADVDLIVLVQGGRGEVAHRAADAHQATAAVGQPAARSASVSRTWSRTRLQILLLRRAAPGEELLGDPHGTQLERRQRLRAPVGDLDQLHAAAADLEHRAVGDRRGVDGGDVAEAGLLLGRQHLDLQPGGLLGGAHELAAVVRIADRAGGDRVHLAGVDLVGGAEAREHPERLEAPLDRIIGQAAGGAEPGADPHRLVELVGALPPGVRRVGEDDQAPRVRSEIDDCDLSIRLLGVPGGAGRSPAHA